MTNQYKYLKFYDKNGDNLNLDYDDTIGQWTGNIYIPKVSTDLIESYQIFLAEEFKAGPTYSSVHGTPHIFGATGATSTVLASWITDETPEMFFFTFDSSLDKILLEKSTTQELTFDIDATETIAATGSTGIKYTTNVTNAVISINVGFCPKDEFAYEDILTLTDNETGDVFAKITIYGEGISEDKRLGVLLDNLGWNVNNTDFKIFQATDIKEDIPDNKKLNQKRKELLLEFENIFPYLGSYKSLINIIKYFGYDNVKLKEYWLNVDAESVNFGKYRQTDIVDIFSDDGDPNVSDRLIPNKLYKKTSKFGLFYNITEWDGGYDADGVPTVIESNQFSLEEVLIKLYALKQKLKSHFLPLNARIVDIIGEALYFTKYDINVWTDQTRIDNVDLNIKPKVNILPSDFGYINDLRALQFLGCPIAPDLSIGGTHSYGVYDYTINGADQGDVFVIRDTITNNSITYTTQYLENDAETMLGLVDAWNSSVNYPFINFQVYPFGATANGVMRVVQQQITDFDFVFEVTQGPVAGTPTLTSSELFMGASGMNEYSECFIGYFENNSVEVENLNDDVDIPVGYAIVLENKSFEIPWDDMSLTWNSLDEIEITTGASNFGGPLYGPYAGSFYNLAATGPSGSIYESVGATQFPFSIYNSTGNGIYQWENIEKCNFYEMQWIITLTESGQTGASGWIHNSGYQPIDTIKNYPLILPWEGKYRLELYMRDLFNGVSYLKTENYIEVDLKNVNMVGWYESRKPEYTWDDKREARVMMDGSREPLIEDLSWDETNSTWNLPVQPNEEIDMFEMSFDLLDKIEFYQRQEHETPTDPKISVDPYTWNNLGDDSEWDDMNSLYWDYCNPQIVRFVIDEIGLTGPTITLNHIITGRQSEFTFSDLGSTGASGFREAVRQLNTNIGASAINTNTIGRSDINTENMFDRFIYYYSEKYEEALGATHGHQLIPFITAVSKDLEVPRRITTTYAGMTGNSYTQLTINMGAVGDLPSGFEIYEFVPGGTFTIDDNLSYTIGATTTNMQELVDELNAVEQSHPSGVDDYNWNVVIGQTGGTHTGTGATGMVFDHYVKIIATNKAFVTHKPVLISYGSGLIGTTYGRNLSTNPTWDSLRPIKYSTILNNLSKINFTYDNSSFHGGKKPIWKIHKENDENWEDIYYRNSYLSYLFTEVGSYSISLQLEDTNGNINNITKREFIKII